MKNAFEKYSKMLLQLRKMRAKNKDVESKEEDDLLDEMDKVWFQLTDSERKELDKK